ncbi:holo-ACP synthase [Pseudoduganella namucuonensis]|uniref:Holo-[acyl-carrier-protein] synthase n=1 Tax=Pseudoduganella namucuonensis TaxID=1035707 RepID=A0A1I7LGB0_9BURK|nr:holo-ACP synthase [Pseudoduganella namucuonensis]SFV08721.1 holo-[acyl-carrier protein] synthase [Pseudoduganella namucuonensis]
MIYGVGTDICQISRVAQSLERSGARFAEKILGPEELLQYRKRSANGSGGAARGLRYLATRFAAKEAFGKAIGTGVAGPMTLRNAQLLNEDSGKPVMVCSGTLAEFMQSHRLSSQVSVSDEAEYAVAFVIVEQAPETV